MRILHLSSWGFVPEILGFSPEFHLAKTQAEMGHDVTALTFRSPKEDTFEIENMGSLRIIRIPYFIHTKSIGRSLVLYPRLASVKQFLNYLTELQYDVAHLHFSVSALSIIASIWNSFKRKTPIVITNHDPLIASGREKLHVSLYLAARHLFRQGSFRSVSWSYLTTVPFRLADAIVVFTRFEGELFASQGIEPGKLHIIPDGVNLRKLWVAKKGFFESLGIPKPVVLNVGRYAPQKGQAHLLMAAKEVSKKTGAHFVFIGHSLAGRTNVSDLSKLSEELGISNRVHFLMDVSDAELASAYNDCDVFAFPSLYESFGMALVEAMAAGKPVVAYRIAGLPEILGDGKYGLLVNLGDIAGLSEAILKLLSSPNLATNLAQSARNWANSEFNWQNIALRTLELYSKLL